MTLEASFTKCQGLCSFQEHFPQKVGQCLKPASTPSHCIYVRIHSNSAFFAPSGQRLSSPGHKKSTIIGQITPTPDVMSRNSGSKIRSTFSRWQREKKFRDAVCIVTPQNFPSFKFYSLHLHHHYHHHHHHH